jgi:hypothetical protein
MTYLQLIDKGSFRELKAEWRLYLADNLVNEHYRPFMEYVERLLRRPDPNRKIYALVEDMRSAATSMSC